MRKRKKAQINHSDKKIIVNSTPDKRKRIVVVDDDESIRDIFHIILSSAGYQVDLKYDGVGLLNGKSTRPHLFLIDKQLSGSNGLDLCREIRRRPETWNIPVIMMSASPDINRLAPEAGADDFIEKPFDMNDVLEKIQYFLRNGRTVNSL